jgi:hypothetical protein
MTAQKTASAELPHLTADDPILTHLKTFTTKTQSQVEQLKQLHRDLLGELAGLQIYFAEKPDQPVEEIFTTILSFALTLQKASVEMSKYPDPPRPPKVPVLHTTTPSSGSDTTPTATINRPVAGLRGTMTRGELDEAIRSIHGGVRRRERREASLVGGTGSSVKLSRMFLDGAGSVSATIGRGTVSKRTRLGSVFN